MTEKEGRLPEQVHSESREGKEGEHEQKDAQELEDEAEGDEEVDDNAAGGEEREEEERSGTGIVGNNDEDDAEDKDDDECKLEDGNRNESERWEVDGESRKVDGKGKCLKGHICSSWTTKSKVIRQGGMAYCELQ